MRMAWTFSASAALVGEPSLRRDGTVSLARSFLRELLARADYSTSALIPPRSRLASSDALKNDCSQISPGISSQGPQSPQISSSCPDLRPDARIFLGKTTTYSISAVKGLDRSVVGTATRQWSPLSGFWETIEKLVETWHVCVNIYRFFRGGPSDVGFVVEPGMG